MRRTRGRTAAVAASTIAAAFAAAFTAAWILAPEAARAAAADAPSVDPLDPARDIGFDQKLGAQVPLDLTFRDEAGREVRLGDYFGRRPVLLSLAYYECPMLCGMALQGVARSMKGITFAPSREFEIVTVSFDPREKPDLARLKKGTFVDFYGRPGAAEGWHFLTGDPEPIRRLTEAVGFRYAWDESAKQFAHATGLVVLTPDGRIARYLFGTDYAPKDLRLSLVEAAGGKIGSLSDTLLLLCYRYDPRTGRYSRLALGSVRAGAALTVLGLGTFIVVMLWRERRARAAGVRPLRARAGETPGEGER
jgi:protein SCO1/2